LEKRRRHIWLGEHLRLMVDDYDRPTAIIGLWLDVTEEKQRKAERRRAAASAGLSRR